MPGNEKRNGPATTTEPPETVPTPSTTQSVPDATDLRRFGELWNVWLGIQLDTIDSLTADAAAKVAAIPDLHQLWLLIGELTVRLHCAELAIDELKAARR